jgi:biopolymer transport protein ExbD
MAMGSLPGGEDDEGGEGVFAEINITPLTDIFLVLLIIFMVTSTVIVQAPGAGGAKAGLKVNLPQGGSADVAVKRKDLSVAVLTDGRMVVDGKVVSLEELREVLARARAEDPSTLVVVQADEGVAHGRVVQVMEASKGAGLGQIAIGVRQGPGGGP